MCKDDVCFCECCTNDYETPPEDSADEVVDKVKAAFAEIKTLKDEIYSLKNDLYFAKTDAKYRMRCYNQQLAGFTRALKEAAELIEKHCQSSDGPHNEEIKWLGRYADVKREE